METIGKHIVIRGELHTTDDLTVEGRIEGHIFCEDSVVVLGATSAIVGDLIARDVTVHGHVKGTLIATDVVDVRPEATITGRVVSKRFILDEAARFDGHVEPQHLEAALRVAHFQQRKRVTATG